MRPHLIVDNSETKTRRTKSLLFGRRIARRSWAAVGATEMLGYMAAGSAFIVIGWLLYHFMPSEHPTYMDRKLIGGFFAFFGFAMFYKAGRENLFAIPVITSFVLVAQYLFPPTAEAAITGRDVVLYSIIAVVVGGIMRLSRPRYEEYQ